MEKYDFSGWATKNDLKCSDGRIIRKDAFKHNDGQTVPLVWNHDHSDPYRIVGRALLENRDEGVYAYCSLNDTELGRTAKIYVKHGDINQLSIYANQLRQQGPNVMHGAIREVSLVMAGANPGAYIENVMIHGEESEEEGCIFTGETISLYHADEMTYDQNENVINHKEEESMADNEKTVKDVFDEMTEEQKNVVYAMVGAALEDDGDDDDEEGGEGMKHNVFDQDELTNEGVLSHSEVQAIISDAKRYGSMKESFLAHAGEEVTNTIYADKTQTYGINGTDFLFPDARLLNNTPEFIKREMGWVSKVMSSVHHTPFSRIKSMFADITEPEARAKGYIKGKLKKEEVFSLLKRTTTPTTIYKKQKMDRDDVIDITDMDVIAWLKSEMRMMLDEEIARAILIGDGRLPSDDDHINETNIRPVWKDEDLYTVKKLVETEANASASDKAKAFIRTIIKARKDYKGSGDPTLYTTEDQVTECLLIEDMNGRIIYDSLDKLKSVLRVKEIVTVPVMEGLTRTGDSGEVELLGLIVNLKDYNVGADKGGAVNMFDDFDIDYNAMKYLIETRCSGALIKPFSAIAIETAKVSG